MNKLNQPAINRTLVVGLASMFVTGGIAVHLVQKYYGNQPPVGYKVIIGETAEIIVKILDEHHEIACVSGIDGIDKTSKIDLTSEDQITQMTRDIYPRETITFSRTGDQRYTTLMDSEGHIIARIMNQNGNGTARINSKQALESKIKKCTEKE